jgi:hypothetical protein
MRSEIERKMSAAATDNTEKKQSGLIPFKTGQSGNPAGRPKGSRNKLAGEFIDALASDFADNGAAAIAKVRQDKPDVYIRVVAAILPKELDIALNVSAFADDYQDAREFARAYKLARSMIGATEPPMDNSPVIEMEPDRRDSECDYDD